MADLVYINSADPPSKQATDINYNFSVVESGSGGGGEVTSADITDATTVGRSVLTAANAAAARTAIGAGTGTSNLAIGTTSTTAKAGDYQPTWAQVTGKPTTFAPVAATAAVVGGVKTASAPVITITDPADTASIQDAFDSLVAALKLSGVLT